MYKILGVMALAVLAKHFIEEIGDGVKERIKYELSSVRIKDFSLAEDSSVFEFTLAITNQNSFPIYLHRFAGRATMGEATVKVNVSEQQLIRAERLSLIRFDVAVTKAKSKK